MNKMPPMLTLTLAPTPRKGIRELSRARECRGWPRQSGSWQTSNRYLRHGFGLTPVVSELGALGTNSSSEDPNIGVHFKIK